MIQLFSTRPTSGTAATRTPGRSKIFWLKTFHNPKKTKITSKWTFFPNRKRKLLRNGYFPPKNYQQNCNQLFDLYGPLPETGDDSGHGEGDEAVEISVGRVGQLEGAEADVVRGINGVLDQLVDGQRGVVRLDPGVGNLEYRWN